MCKLLFIHDCIGFFKCGRAKIKTKESIALKIVQDIDRTRAGAWEQLLRKQLLVRFNTNMLIINVIIP